MLNKKDMNQYNTNRVNVPAGRAEGELSVTAAATAKTVGGMVWKAVKTLLFVVMITGLLVFISVASFILSFRDTEPPNLSAMKLNYSSFIYLDEGGNSTEYMTLFSNENRVMVSLEEIPEVMQWAQIAIEDQRFYEHGGVDWYSTLGAVYKLASNSGQGGGGSTLTQQLIKNLTKENQVSILRKVKEIFTALNLEKKFSKEEVLEAYLNVVNYGGQCQGVQAAANYYYDKDISQCSLAECALIAGITQNPYQNNPMIFPDKAKSRAETVLDKMKELEYINEADHTAALAELRAMDFVGAELEDLDKETEDMQDSDKWNWYIDTMFEDLVRDIAAKYNISDDLAENMLYNGGLEIHCSMDLKMQTDIEKIFLGEAGMPEDLAIQAGFFMMDPYTGKVMAVVGSRQPRNGIRLWNNGVQARRQSGSAIKPIGPYAVGLNTGAITYGTVLKDEPMPGYSSDGETWPNNFSLSYEGSMNVDEAVMVSQNAPATWLAEAVTPEACFDFLVNQLHFTTLAEVDSHSLSSVALGGQEEGVTVREMTAGFQIFANGGNYYAPYTYDYVRDHDGNVILDNRGRAGEQVMSPANATVMNKLLHEPVYGDQGTAHIVQIDGLDIYGKTGTTDGEKDFWFVGATPFCVAGVWNGYENPSRLEDSTTAKWMWREVINYMVNNYDFSDKGWILSEEAQELVFCRSSGKLAGGSCYATDYGWYSPENIPGTCNGSSDHISNKKYVNPNVSAAPSSGPSSEPSSPPTTGPSAGPSESPPPSSGPITAPPTDTPTTPPVTETPPPTVPPITDAPVTDPPPTFPPVTDPPVTDPPVPPDPPDPVITDPPLVES